VWARKMISGSASAAGSGAEAATTQAAGVVPAVRSA
jgi:hypothetical protein